MKRWHFPILCGAALLVVGCGSGDNDGNGSGSVPAPSAASFQITSPAAGATNASPELAVTVQPANFQIVNNPGGPNVAGQGHLFSWIDADPTNDPSTPGAQQAFQSQFEVADVVTPGSHTLYVELRNNDGTPLSPRVIRQVTFTTPAIQFSQDILRIFTNNGARTCAQAGCHSGASAAASGGQNLEAANAYANIVNVPSTEQPALMRVAPGDSENSYLYRKITGAPGIVGERMPLAGGPLDEADIERIALWIEQGAANN